MKSMLEKYKNSNFKMTPQRMAILEYLDGNRQHPSAEEIYRSVSVRFPTMSFATVYNTLEMLVSKGKVMELTIDVGKKRFDPDTTPHHHLICRSCRSIADIFEDFSIEVAKGSNADFDITGHHIEFYGICPSCKK
ncbi:MAG: transcriptional repressor [Thermodesulfovibrio sp.]|nr:transcriptional repressor [Thermodesulfovibrio sp.]